MATWAIGDVHGCFRTLAALIARLDFDENRDRLWMVGDLVNRGPSSLKTLRWACNRAEALGGRFVAVLGNHDLHLIARQLGVSADRPGDTLEELLGADDVQDLAGWLRARPFVHLDRVAGHRVVLVHAGLPPGWSRDVVRQAARRLEERLQGASAVGLLRRPPPDDAEGLAAFTLTRMIDRSGQADPYNGPPEQAPKGLDPWFDAIPRACPGDVVVCGHWAALGLRLAPELIALDTGCVWGGQLTACRLEDRLIVQQPVLDPLPG